MDYGLRQASRTERLGVFGGDAAAGVAGRSRSSVSLPALTLAVFAVTAAAVWMAGGAASVSPPRASPQVSPASLSAAATVAVTDRAALVPDPMVTASIAARPTEAVQEGFTTAAPRPARIERAGSILMIRPAGN
ncbi:hypothetical protein PZ897_07685 [Hoeflea sp. YIM 152468]|uniref:hypothetical protein n=1 Tax=Hoeflea sp. YIM 152468 TaxID=3031759 RepID=UPI0023DAB9AD|nr:hypothetical protein [Hoeflea sp. YIM 152468]MDF1608051.1 hypothetical protein [Hoeflea sp. YIM 152468]